jgi:hypothetical protein
MSSDPQANTGDVDGLEAAVDQAIAASGGDMRSTIRALIVANDYLETEVRRIDEGRVARLCAREISDLFRLGVDQRQGKILRALEFSPAGA